MKNANGAPTQGHDDVVDRFEMSVCKEKDHTMIVVQCLFVDSASVVFLCKVGRI